MFFGILLEYLRWNQLYKTNVKKSVMNTENPKHKQDHHHSYDTSFRFPLKNDVSEGPNQGYQKDMPGWLPLKKKKTEDIHRGQFTYIEK